MSTNFLLVLIRKQAKSIQKCRTILNKRRIPRRMTIQKGKDQKCKQREEMKEE
jgi:hypothetical protein